MSKFQYIDWTRCQALADQALAEGAFLLRQQSQLHPQQVTDTCPGNYLISHGGEPPFYVGEAQNIVARVKQQFKPDCSTFYKTVLKKHSYCHLHMDVFSVQCSKTTIGRKELEEFCIVNLPTHLNKFQLGKRGVVPHATSSLVWEAIQAKSVDLLDQGVEAALAQQSVPWFEASPPSLAGLYIVRHGAKNERIYIGESSDLSERYSTHSKLTYFSALRRHIATEMLGFELKTRDNKKRYLTQMEDEAVTNILRASGWAHLSVSLGRFELEEFLIRKYRPRLNRKNNQK